MYVLVFLLVLLGALVYAVPSSADVLQVPEEYLTIQQAINASSDGDTVLVAPDTYTECLDFGGRDIVLGSRYLTTGEESFIANTIIDGGSQGSVVRFGSGEGRAAMLVGFTVQNGISLEGGGVYCRGSAPTIRDNIIRSNLADAGGGVYCEASAPLIAHNRIEANSLISPLGMPGGGISCVAGSNAIIEFNEICYNENQDGGGIACMSSSPLIRSNVIHNNVAFDLGGALRCDYGAPALVNNTITDNTATMGGGLFVVESGATVNNAIIWGNSASAAGDQVYLAGGALEMTFSDVEGGWEGNGNLDLDPRFRAAGLGDWHLMAIACGDPHDSPCIDTGDPAISDSLLHCAWGLGAYLSDMGAYGGSAGDCTAVAPLPGDQSRRKTLLSSYPNPFAVQTTITYRIPAAAARECRILDPAGRVIRHLEGHSSGQDAHQRFVWDGTNTQGRRVADGVYYCIARSAAGCFGKMIVLVR